MDDLAAQAVAEAARRKVKRASGLLHEATRELAALTEAQDHLSVLRAHDRQSADAAHELVELGLARYGAVDVVVIARPSRRSTT